VHAAVHRKEKGRISNGTPKFQARFPQLVLHRFVNCLEINESAGGRREKRQREIKTNKNRYASYFSVSLSTIFSRSASFMRTISSRDASYEMLALLNGFSSLLSNSFRQMSIRCCFRRPGCSSSISGSRRASNAAYAARYRRSGWRSTLVLSGPAATERASRAFSMPEALRVVSLWDPSSSSCDMSKVPREGAELFF
jgi:hypothetical protein